MIGWGFYFRNACDGVHWYRIPIKIYKCRRQERGGYLSIHPTFLLPYKQYTFSVIYGVLAGYFLLGLTMRESLNQIFQQDVLVFYQTVQHWIRDLKEGSGLWISLLQEEGRFSLSPSVSSLRAKELVHVMRRVPVDSTGEGGGDFDSRICFEPISRQSFNDSAVVI